MISKVTVLNYRAVKRDGLNRQMMDDFRRIVQALRTSHRVAEHLDLTGAQLFVVSVLGEADGPLSVTDVARETQTDPSTVSVVVGRLVEAGYVKRARSREDTRRIDLSLTAKGNALRRQYPQSVPQRRLAKALGRLSPSDAKTLARLLTQIVNEMELRSEPAPMMFADSERPGTRRRS